MSRFTQQQEMQTNLLSLIMLRQRDIEGSPGMTIVVCGLLILWPFLVLPVALFFWLDRRKAERNLRAKLEARVAELESGEVCNSYTHVELLRAKKELAALG